MWTYEKRLQYPVKIKCPNAAAANKFLNYILEPESAAQCFNWLGYYCTIGAADELVNPALVVPDSVTSGEIVQNISADAEAVHNKNWIDFKAACGA